MRTTKTTKEIAKEIRDTFKKMTGVKVSVTSEYNHLYVNLMQAPWMPVNEKIIRGVNNDEYNFNGSYSVNHFYFKDDKNLTTEGKIFFQMVAEIVNKYHWDESDSMTDYFNCAFYYDFEVGKWDRKFQQI